KRPRFALAAPACRSSAPSPRRRAISASLSAADSPSPPEAVDAVAVSSRPPSALNPTTISACTLTGAAVLADLDGQRVHPDQRVMARVEGPLRNASTWISR